MFRDFVIEYKVRFRIYFIIESYRFQHLPYESAAEEKIYLLLFDNKDTSQMVVLNFWTVCLGIRDHEDESYKTHACTLESRWHTASNKAHGIVPIISRTLYAKILTPAEDFV